MKKTIPKDAGDRPLSEPERQELKLVAERFIKKGQMQDIISDFIGVVAANAAKSKDVSNLYRLAAESTKYLNYIAEKEPAVAQKVAERNLLWPALISGAPLKLNEAKQLTEKIRLGANPALPVDPKKVYRTETVARIWALEAIKVIEQLRLLQTSEGDRQKLSERIFFKHEIGENDLIQKVNFQAFCLECSHLQPLDSDSLDNWKRVVRVYVMFVTKGHPEKHPKLRGLGIYQKEKAGAKIGTKTSEANIRDAIFSKIYQAIEAVV